VSFGDVVAGCKSKFVPTGMYKLCTSSVGSINLPCQRVLRTRCVVFYEYCGSSCAHVPALRSFVPLKNDFPSLAALIEFAHFVSEKFAELVTRREGCLRLMSGA